MTIYQREKTLQSDLPLAFPKAPEAYELRLIDEDKSNYAPDYSIGALDRRERVGTHDALAFVQVKNYKPKANALEEEVDPKLIEQLKAEGKRLITVQVNTSLLKTKF